MKVPLVSTAALSEFGDLRQASEYFDPTIMDRDHSYVPGFSDLRRQRDVAVAKHYAGELAAGDVPTLPVNCRWARAQKVDGSIDNTKLFTHGRRGYRLANAKEHVGTGWLTELPPGCAVQPDGSIRNGDCVLVWASQDDARRNEALKRRMTEQRLTGAVDAFAQNLAASHVHVPTGTNPSVAVEQDPASAQPAASGRPSKDKK